MSKLPNAERAIVPEANIRRYLLDLTSKPGRAKAQFFLAFGFTLAAWEELATALKRHALTYDVATTRATAYGIHYTVEGSLVSPDGRNPQVRSVWKINTGESVPSLVTAYPLKAMEDDHETL